MRDFVGRARLQAYPHGVQETRTLESKFSSCVEK